MKKWLIPLSLGLIVYLLYKGSFSASDLYTNIPRGSEETAHIVPFLEQKFTYIGEGSQMYAFVSEDQTTVLKLFKARHERPLRFSEYVKNLGKKDWEQSRRKWQIKFQETCRRYKTAFFHLKEETGLIFIHFQKTPISLPVTLKKRATIQLDLSQYPFVLQKKATLAPEYVRNHPEGVEALRQFFANRTHKGFSDPRQSLSVNYGFIGETPIQIDPGKLEPFEGDPQAEIIRIHKHVDEWALNLMH